MTLTSTVTVMALCYLQVLDTPGLCVYLFGMSSTYVYLCVCVCTIDMSVPLVLPPETFPNLIINFDRLFHISLHSLHDTSLVQKQFVWVVGSLNV